MTNIRGEATYDLMPLRSLPSHLRSELMDVHGNKITDIGSLSPNTLIFVQTTDNPGDIPFVISNYLDLYKFVENVAKNTNVSITKLCESLSKKVGN
jgi:hypothetical protein